MDQRRALVSDDDLAAAGADSNAGRVVQRALAERAPRRAIAQPQHHHLARTTTLLRDERRVPDQHRHPWATQACPLPRDAARALHPILAVRHDEPRGVGEREHGRGVGGGGGELLRGLRAAGPQPPCWPAIPVGDDEGGVGQLADFGRPSLEGRDGSEGAGLGEERVSAGWKREVTRARF